MKKYMLTISILREVEYQSISTTSNDVDFISFSADVDNAAFQDFLAQAQLSFEGVLNLEPNTWFDFPEETA